MPDDDQTRLPEYSNSSNLLTPGQAFGQYRVTRLLGRGGMGEVYEVAHTVLHRRYALKVIRPEVLSRPSAVERFRREAQVMNHLEHPNIVQVDEYGETDGHTWLRMQLIGGGVADENGEERMANGESSLADLLTGEPLPEALVVDLISQILEGLAYAHGKGAIHRDIKPSNILLEVNHDFNTAPTRKEAEAKFSPSSASKKTKLSVHLAKLSGKNITAKIADFGLVHMAGEDWVQSQVKLTVARSQMDPPSTGSGQADATHMDGEGQMADGGSQAGTSTQALLGTFEYMAPEQKRGEPADERSDLYAVGLIAFRMLTGHEAPGFELPSELVPGLNPTWDQWIKQALAQDIERRVESAQAMLNTLPSDQAAAKETASSSSESGSKVSGKNQAKKSSKAKGLLWGVGVIALVVVLAVLGLRLSNTDKESRELEETRRAEAIAAAEATAEAERQETAQLRAEPEATEGPREAELAEAESNKAAEQERLAKLEAARMAEIAKEEAGRKTGQELSANRTAQSKALEQDISFDLGGGETLEMVWVEALDGWVGKYELTNGQYRRFKNSHHSGEYRGHSFNGKDQPVVQVNFNEAQAYANWLNEKLSHELPGGFRFGLPDGTQWMTYARCGDARNYPWGNSWPPEYGNYHGQEGAGSWSKIDGYRDDHPVTAPVASSVANEWGLYGVGGNAWEWTTDQSGLSRVLRGGSWYDRVAGFLRIDCVNKIDPKARVNDVGFRVVLFR